MHHIVVLLLKLVSSDRGQSQKLVCLKLFNELSRGREAPTAKSSISEARSHLPWQAMEHLLDQSRMAEPAWNGHGVFAVDASILQLPRSASITKSFPVRKTGEFYPSARAICAFNVHTLQPIKAQIDSIHISELRQIDQMLKHFKPGDVLLLDRGFHAQKLRASIQRQRLHFVMRLRMGKITKALGRRKDLLIQENGITFRVVRCRKLIIMTNLINRTKYPRSALLALYKQRWVAETQFRRLKVNLKLKKFHAKSVNGIKQEIYAGLLLMALIAEVTKKIVLPENRLLNFVAAYELVGKNLSVLLLLRRAQGEKFLRAIYKYLKKFFEPKRPRRSYPRYSKQPENKWIKARRRNNHTQKGHWKYSDKYR